jgi:hypothetical protein
MRNRLFAVLAAASAILACPASAATIHVPADQPTIQAGVNAAAIGDMVMVAPGTYYEHYIVMRSGVVLRSETGQPACVTLDAQHENRVFHCQGMSSRTKIEGFTIINGLEDGSGGIWCVYSSMTIENCVFIENEVRHDSGAIGLFTASPTIWNCTFLRNRTLGMSGYHNRGGAIYMQVGCSPLICGYTFTEHEAWQGGAIWCNDNCTPTIADCVFLRNKGREGGAIAIEGNSTFQITDCVFAENAASEEGGGLYLNSVGGVVAGCTLYGNMAILGGGQVYATNPLTLVEFSHSIIAFGNGRGTVECTSPGILMLSCCDVFGNVGGDWLGCIAGQGSINNNFRVHPLFCDPGLDDFSLSQSSPCLNAPNCGLVGAIGQGCGPISLQSSSWAHVKARYR